MLGRTHALSGAAAYVAVVGLDPAGMALCALAALGPDIDHHNSILGRWTPLWRVLPHRGPTHYLLTAALIGGGLWLVYGWTWWTIAIALGWLAHQVGDAITTAGLRWVWPLKLTIRGPLRTGGLAEHFIVAPLLLGFIFWEVLQWSAS